ncbi:hypothetical protein G8764_13840 [Pseudomaricurvus alcaniphilus]|uniref:alkaline phosphatase D family protein n=1 Tax=Pseudomaricurvus alcaniphilus TaxID=1166482 RepID=UPI00140ADE6B|nr:alkaline phosphatase D family protein [Pseudomaricurvus alcaniphilus]NHN38384.1 hypothetical protein [Pseudomaricurvus alcaniphilus]
MKRRHFLKAGATALGATLLPSAAATAAAARPNLTQVTPLSPLPGNTTCNWLGGDFWGNRLQDWRMHNGRIECLRGEASFEVRTCALLTRSLTARHQPARLRARVGNLTPGQDGFCGFLLGVGGGQLDYRGSALAQRAAGEGGGFMAVMDNRGELGFRDFSNAGQPLAFEKIQRSSGVDIGDLGEREILLDCHIDPLADGKFDVRLVAVEAGSGRELGFAVRTGVPARELQGGMSLVSSPPTKAAGARWWFADIASGGGKIEVKPEHGLGAVMGCLYSLNRRVLKLTAQFVPIDLGQHQQARFDYRQQGTRAWTRGPASAIEDGFVALFRVDGWDSAHAFDYRIVFPERGDAALFEGQVVADPGQGKKLKIALYSCIIPTSRSLDEPFHTPIVPEERIAGRYTAGNILFPHSELVQHCDYHRPDLYVFCGDQYYETYPTRAGRDTPDAKLDTLYRWYLWYWTFRDSVRNRPAIILADDHDVLQGNLWGQGGADSDKPREEDGGFKWDKELVRMVYRIQHGHNPDAYDPTPIAYDIPVTYGHFVYGGVSFAVIEDRKFKTAPDYQGDPTSKRGELLGPRQEQFLQAWAGMDKGLPKVCLTASIWGSPQTKGEGLPLLDYDANGYPPDGRTRAVKLVQAAGALVLAGDQHLGMVARQGIDGYEDGPLFFAGPAAAAFWQRWFEGGGKLANQRNGDPNTGNFVDTFGNRMRVLAVANPKLTYSDFMDDKTRWGMFLGDRDLKSEGYGIVEVDHQAQQFELQCWSWDANPATDSQFKGWPVVAPFEKPVA